jgi:hypothetical protein
MHDGAYNFIASMLARLDRRLSVVELGSRTVLPQPPIRPLFDGAAYIGVDIVAGPNVDVVDNAATWRPPVAELDTVVCCETLEHTPEAEKICRNAWLMLDSGGVFLLTAAGDGREPHSATDGGPLRQVLCEKTHMQIDEFYHNVSRQELRGWLRPFRFVLIDTDTPTDIYALAVK